MKTNIYVFQTSVQTEAHILMLKDEINRLPEIKHWNFDLSDPDLRVFRIEAVKNISETVISLFARFDFKCMELTAEKNQYFSLG